MEKVKKAFQSPFSSGENLAITLGLVGGFVGAGYMGYRFYKSSQAGSKSKAETKPEPQKPLTPEELKFKAFEEKVLSEVKVISKDPTMSLTSKHILDMIQVGEYHNRASIAEKNLKFLKERQAHLKKNDMAGYSASVQEFLKYEAGLPSLLLHSVGDQFDFSANDLDGPLERYMESEKEVEFEQELTKILLSWVHDDAHYKSDIQLSKELVMQAYEFGLKNIKLFEHEDPHKQFDLSQIYLNDLIHQKFGFTEFDLLRATEIKDDPEVIKKSEEIQSVIVELYQSEEPQITQE